MGIEFDAALLVDVPWLQFFWKENLSSRLECKGKVEYIIGVCQADEEALNTAIPMNLRLIEPTMEDASLKIWERRV
jgi:hypothetical protein